MKKTLRLFNSMYEICPRILLILNSFTENITEDRIFAYDFICVYARDFDITVKNLHGDNAFKFSEVTARMQIIHEGIKQLVLEGMADVTAGNGFSFRITQSGRDYINRFHSTYAETYRDTLLLVKKKYDQFDDVFLYTHIEEKASYDGE